MNDYERLLDYVKVAHPDEVYLHKLVENLKPTE